VGWDVSRFPCKVNFEVMRPREEVVGRSEATCLIQREASMCWYHRHPVDKGWKGKSLVVIEGIAVRHRMQPAGYRNMQPSCYLRATLVPMCSPNARHYAILEEASWCLSGCMPRLYQSHVRYLTSRSRDMPRNAWHGILDANPVRMSTQRMFWRTKSNPIPPQSTCTLSNSSYQIW